MRNFVIMGVAAIAAAVAVQSAPSQAQMDAPAVVKERIDTMKHFGQQNNIIKAYVTEDKGTAAEVKAAADKIAAVAPKIPSLFPEGTGRGTLDPKVTRAEPKIWEDAAGFEKAAMNLEATAMAVSKAAESGDKAAVAAAFQTMGKDGCGGCHSTFRGKKVE